MEQGDKLRDIYHELKKISRSHVVSYCGGFWRVIDDVFNNENFLQSFGSLYEEYYLPNAKNGQISWGEIRVNENDYFLLYLQEKGKEGRDITVKLITNDESLVEEVNLGWQDAYLHTIFDYFYTSQERESLS